MRKPPVLFLLGLLALAGSITQAAPLGTAFTYQGRLELNGQTATNGIYYMHFELYDSLNGSGVVAMHPTNTVPVTNGTFATDLDFGGSPFTGQARWLQLDVRPEGGTAEVLSPRTRLAPTPNALFASTAGTVTNGAISVSQLGTAVPPSAGQVLSYDGNSLVWQGAAAVSGAWSASGNSATPGQFLGTVNNQPLELRAKNLISLRIVPGTDQPNSIGGPNIVAGASINSVASDLQGATIGGGGAISIFGMAYPNRILSSSVYSTIGGGLGNTISTNSGESTIAGGNQNTIHSNSIRSVIGGGFLNAVGSNCNTATIAGGTQNSAGSNATFVGGGTLNRANGSSSTIAGGYNNRAQGGSAFIGGGSGNRTDGDAAAVGGGVGNLAGSYSFVGGGLNNSALSDHGSIGGGEDNYVFKTHATVAGGQGNQANGDFSSIGGGIGNYTIDYAAVIAGGEGNTVAKRYSTVGGGRTNNALGSYDTISGGENNLIQATCNYGTIGGGQLNSVGNGDGGTVPGGINNEASGFCTFAAGYNAKARHPGSFVWGGGGGRDFASQLPEQFSVRCTGGARFVTGVDFGGTPTSGVTLGNGGTSWGVISDRNSKKNLQAVDGKAVLEKLAHVRVSSWHYRWEDTNGTPHLGPMAQDFKAAFYPGRDDQVITTLEFDGVELAAIQGLHQLVAEKAARIAALEEKIARLETVFTAQQQTLIRWEARFGALEQAAARTPQPTTARSATQTSAPTADE